VIQSFADGTTEDLFNGRATKAARRIPKAIWPVVRRKLEYLNAARTLADVAHVPGNRLDALHGDLGVLNDGDVVLALSYSGETEELVNLLPALKRFSVKIISLTGGMKSTLARHSDVVLNVKVPKEACPFNLAPTASTTAMLVMGDALAMAILQARGFRQQDFAKHHPSGTIGRALLLRAGDIMRSGSRNAVAIESLTVKQALLGMTRAKAGSVSVTNARGKLVGVFTDGDFRRHMAADDNILVQRLSTVMTRNPISVRDDALAAEALKIFNERNIDDLIVINARREPVGLIDSQDLPKLKLVSAASVRDRRFSFSRI
jgi:arabinose-5-phosphate isomerase